MTDLPESRRRSLRLRNYDYRQAGWYYVTVCIRDRTHCLGEIDERGMHLSPAGEMVQECWDRIPERFPSVEIDERVVMPNHLHGILILTHNGGAGEAQLGEIVGEFKSIGTGAYIRGVRQRGWPAFDGQLWQRNYYEHVIRDDESLRRIREYIRGNPARWDADPENGGGMDAENSARRAPTRGAPTSAIGGNVGIGEARVVS